CCISVSFHILPRFRTDSDILLPISRCGTTRTHACRTAYRDIVFCTSTGALPQCYAGGAGNLCFSTQRYPTVTRGFGTGTKSYRIRSRRTRLMANGSPTRSGCRAVATDSDRIFLISTPGTQLGFGTITDSNGTRVLCHRHFTCSETALALRLRLWTDGDGVFSCGLGVFKRRICTEIFDSCTD